MLKTLRLASAAGMLLAATSVGALAQSSVITPPPGAPGVMSPAIMAPSANNTGNSGSSSDISQTGKVSGTVTGPQAVVPETKSPQLGSGNEK